MSASDQSSSLCAEEASTAQICHEKKVEVSKHTLRKQVWTYFEKNGLVTFPYPVQGRIPNFYGAPEAAAKLSELNAFKNATYIKVNSDKPQEYVRILTLEKKKKLLVPAPRIKEAVFMHMTPKGTGTDFKKAASRRGMLQWGKPCDLCTDIKIDLVVMGSVAVSRQGHRLGRGEGFGDLEFAILVEIGAITNNTVIATTVHDSQVFDTLPNELFKEYDVPVDIIVTPTEVIHVNTKLPRSKGIMWNLLSERKMNTMVVLKVLREKIKTDGKECQLKAEDTDSETERTKRHFYPVKRFVKYTKKRSSLTVNGAMVIDEKKGESDGKKKEKIPERRFNRRFRRTIKTETNSTIKGGMKKQHRSGLRRRNFQLSPPIQFSLRIGNITSNIRVRDLKNALAERNVKPTDITWRGQKGFAFIHFVKPKKDQETPVIVDNIVASLQDMKIGNDREGVTLLVEPAKPINEIEMTPDITAV